MPCAFVATCFVERSPRCIESGGLAFTLTATRPYDGRRPVEASSVIDLGSFSDADGRALEVVILRAAEETDVHQLPSAGNRFRVHIK